MFEEEEVEKKKERRGSKEEAKGRRGSTQSWSSLGRRRSKDGGARRRSKNEGRGSDSSIIGQGRSLHNTHRHHLFHNNPSHGIHSSPMSIHFVKNLFQHLLHHSNRHYYYSTYSTFIFPTRQQQEISIRNRNQTIWVITFLWLLKNLAAEDVTICTKGTSVATRITVQSKNQPYCCQSLSIYLTPPTPSAPLTPDNKALFQDSFLLDVLQNFPQVLVLSSILSCVNPCLLVSSMIIIIIMILLLLLIMIIVICRQFKIIIICISIICIICR